MNDVDSITLAKALGLEPVIEAKPPIMGPPPFGFPGTFYYTKPECLDCTLTGSNKKPPFWP